MPSLTRSLLFAFAFAASFGGLSVQGAVAADVARAPEGAYPSGPFPGCAQDPGAWGCGWWHSCRNEDFPWSPECRERFARHDDHHCRVWGPPGSPVYLQCRENRYYDRLSLPLRATK